MHEARFPVRHELGQPFHAIRLLATRALAQAKEDRDFDDAVNWADLRVISVEYYETDAGTHGYRCYIEEASPSAHKLAAFVHDELLKHGLNVQVVTEW